MYKEGGENREALLHDQRVDGMTPEFSTLTNSVSLREKAF